MFRFNVIGLSFLYFNHQKQPETLCFQGFFGSSLVNSDYFGYYIDDSDN